MKIRFFRITAFESQTHQDDLLKLFEWGIEIITYKKTTRRWFLYSIGGGGVTQTNDI